MVTVCNKEAYERKGSERTLHLQACMPFITLNTHNYQNQNSFSSAKSQNMSQDGKKSSKNIG